MLESKIKQEPNKITITIEGDLKENLTKMANNIYGSIDIAFDEYFNELKDFVKKDVFNVIQ